jgi:hypothetical protein
MTHAPRRASTSAFLAVLALAGSAVAAPKTTKVDIDTRPTGAEVFLVSATGESSLGTTPLAKVKLSRGTVHLRFALEGYQELIESVEVGATAQALVFNLVRQIKPGSLEFFSAPEFEGAGVTVDGKPEGTLPTTIAVPPGRHQVIITKTGFESWTRWVDVGEAEKVKFEVVLKPSEKPKASIWVTSVPPGAEVQVNGAPYAETPVLVENLLAGQPILVALSLDGHKAWKKTLSLNPNERYTIDARMVPLQAPTATLKVASTPVGAAISLNGQALGSAPLEKTGLTPGHYVVEARIDGHDPARHELDITGTETALVNLALSRKEVKIATTLKIVSNVAGATVSIDGNPAVPAPVVKSDITPGTHFVSVTAPKHLKWENKVTLQEGEALEIVAELQKAGHLLVRTADGGPAEVLLDGAPIGQAPVTKDDLAIKAYRITARAPDGRVHEREVTLSAEAQVEVVVKFEEVKAPEAPEVERRELSFSAQAMDAGDGTVDLHVGWPFWLGLRINGGVYGVRRQDYLAATQPGAFSLERDILSAGRLPLRAVRQPSSAFLDIGEPKGYASAPAFFGKLGLL